MSGVQVFITPVELPDELFCRYSQQHRPQPAVLVLNLESGELSCRYDPEIGNGLPESVWSRRTLWFDIPRLTADAANSLLNEVQPLAQQILDGTTIQWDGHNHVGVLDEDAVVARDELAERCDPNNGRWDDSETVSEWTASDWFGSEGTAQTIARLGLTADTTDEQIAEMAEAEANDARENSGGNGYVILTGAEDYLIDLRDDLANERAAASA